MRKNAGGNRTAAIKQSMLREEYHYVLNKTERFTHEGQERFYMLTTPTTDDEAGDEEVREKERLLLRMHQQLEENDCFSFRAPAPTRFRPPMRRSAILARSRERHTRGLLATAAESSLSSEEDNNDSDYEPSHLGGIPYSALDEILSPTQPNCIVS